MYKFCTQHSFIHSNPQKETQGTWDLFCIWVFFSLKLTKGEKNQSRDFGVFKRVLRVCDNAEEKEQITTERSTTPHGV